MAFPPAVVAEPERDLTLRGRLGVGGVLVGEVLEDPAQLAVHERRGQIGELVVALRGGLAGDQGHGVLGQAPGPEQGHALGQVLDPPGDLHQPLRP